MKIANEIAEELRDELHLISHETEAANGIIAAKLEPVERIFRNMVICCRDLVDQQEMPDDFWSVLVEEAEATLALFEEE